MAALIKELLQDYAQNRLDVTTRIDIQISIERLYKTGQITYEHIKLLDMYLGGYTISELLYLNPGASDMIIKTLFLLEKESGYKDSSFISYGIDIYPKYNKIRSALERMALEYTYQL